VCPTKSAELALLRTIRPHFQEYQGGHIEWSLTAWEMSAGVRYGIEESILSTSQRTLFLLHRHRARVPYFASASSDSFRVFFER
jgi:hypothetical protein